MLLYICTCLVILSVAKSDQEKNFEPLYDKPTNDAPQQSEAIFADVIKNISRVNNVLQELINNYEQLKKIYKSQENVESSYSEIDEIFKSKNDEQSKRIKNDKAVTKKANSEKFAATRMFWSDHDEDNSDSNEDTDQNDEIENNTDKNDYIEPNKGLPRKTTTLEPSEESSDESSDSRLPQEKVKQLNKVKMPDKIKIASIARPKQPQQQAEVIFVDIDTHRKPKDALPTQIEKEVKLEPKIEPSIQLVGKTTKPKTRYSKVSYSEVLKSELQPLSPIPKDKINTRNVKKIMYSESFSPKKIWDDILSNKPIQLEAHNEITLRRLDGVKRNQTAINKRTRNNKSELLIIAKKTKKENDPLSSEDDGSTHKDEIKANVLRHAYGDACLKLVLRKCFKACQKVSKSACNHVKCKSIVKASFKSYSKTGCIKEFQGGEYNETERQTTEKDAMVPLTFRRQESSLVDMTRGGFLSAACLPHVNVMDDKAILRNETPAYRANPTQNFNILRDRFERACKRISSNKCKDACKYAYTKMCDTHTCSKRMKKTFKNQCKLQCNTAYELFSNSDGSDSDSESDDDSHNSDKSGSSE